MAPISRLGPDTAGAADRSLPRTSVFCDGAQAASSVRAIPRKRSRWARMVSAPGCPSRREHGELEEAPGVLPQHRGLLMRGQLGVIDRLLDHMARGHQVDLV